MFQAEISAGIRDRMSILTVLVHTKEQSAKGERAVFKGKASAQSPCMKC